MRKANILLIVLIMLCFRPEGFGQQCHISGKLAKEIKCLHLYANADDPLVSRPVDSCMPGSDRSFDFKINRDGLTFFWIRELATEFMLLPGQDIRLEQISEDSLLASGAGADAYRLNRSIGALHAQLGATYSSFDDPMAFHNYLLKWKSNADSILDSYGKRHQIDRTILEVMHTDLVYIYSLYHYYFLSEINSDAQTIRRKYPDYFSFEKELSFNDQNNFSLGTLHFLMSAYIRAMIDTDTTLMVKGHTYQYASFRGAQKYLQGRSRAYVMLALSEDPSNWVRFPTDTINEYRSEMETVKEELLRLFPDSSFYRKFCENLQNYSGFLPGDAFHDVELTDSLGTAVFLSAYRNKIIYLDIWGTHCSPCIRQLTALNALQERFSKDTNVVFITLCREVDGTKESLDPWKKILREKKVQAVNLYCKDKDFLYSKIGLGLPQHYIIGKNNIIITLGAKPPAYSEGDLRSILARQHN
jgi:thiol-disulfide isomerase/thioredoxin